jgi:hypothetical protein
LITTLKKRPADELPPAGPFIPMEGDGLPNTCLPQVTGTNKQQADPDEANQKS